MSEEHTQPAAPRQGRSQRAAARNNIALEKAFLAASVRQRPSEKVGDELQVWCELGWAGGMLVTP